VLVGPALFALPYKYAAPSTMVDPTRNKDVGWKSNSGICEAITVLMTTEIDVAKPLRMLSAYLGSVCVCVWGGGGVSRWWLWLVL
jgi:hypothetical protein